MTDSWKTNKETKREHSDDRVSRFFVLEAQMKTKTESIRSRVVYSFLLSFFIAFSGCAFVQMAQFSELTKVPESYIAKIPKLDYQALSKELTPINKNIDDYCNTIGWASYGRPIMEECRREIH